MKDVVAAIGLLLAALIGANAFAGRSLRSLQRLKVEAELLALMPEGDAKKILAGRVQEAFLRYDNARLEAEKRRLSARPTPLTLMLGTGLVVLIHQLIEQWAAGGAPEWLTTVTGIAVVIFLVGFFWWAGGQIKRWLER